ncbi:MAG TPA: glycosyltransferase family 4 protein [Candidatus Acidoferrales bacterium]|nr:glycosyltransferase family 4 protein [Candidatus Acidoferrales bacterium]
MSGKPRIVIVSPFLDKSHGTERIIIEWFSRLGDDFELHIYSQRVDDFDRSKFTFHRIWELPGPHIFNYVWWFLANRMRRGWDSTLGGLKPDLVFTPGINCMDADVISVHVVFAQLFREAKPELKLSVNPLRRWPRVLHRRLYYSLIVFLERRIYSNPRLQLVPMAKKTEADLKRFYPRDGDCPILYLGLEHARFNPSRYAELRRASRESLGLTGRDFVALLIGNDLRNKGMPVLLEAISRLPGLPLRLLIVSRESGNTYRSILNKKGLADRVRFLSPRKDVEFYFAAADLYTGPSLEDAFAMPPQEAMACGLPVIVSATAGVSEIITDGENGLILEDPRDANTLAAMIRRVYEDEPFRFALGQNAAKSVEKFTWERNAQDLRAIFDDVLRRKRDSFAMRKALEPDR